MAHVSCIISQGTGGIPPIDLLKQRLQPKLSNERQNTQKILSICELRDRIAVFVICSLNLILTVCGSSFSCHFAFSVLQIFCT